MSVLGRFSDVSEGAQLNRRCSSKKAMSIFEDAEHLQTDDQSATVSCFQRESAARFQA